jgi:hypothetical protein
MLTAKEKRDQRAAQKSAARADGVPAGTAVTELDKINEQQFKDPGSSPDAHGNVVRGPQSGRTVTVACKLGVAWFAMQLCKIEDKFEQNMQGGRTVKEATRIGNVVRIRGTAYPRGTPPAGFPPAPIIADGAALNFGIDAEFWEEWVKQNHLNPLVMNGMVFAHEKEDHVRGLAKETRDNLSGLDPINPKKDVRMPKSGRRDEISDIEPGKRSADAS